MPIAKRGRFPTEDDVVPFDDSPELPPAGTSSPLSAEVLPIPTTCATCFWFAPGPEQPIVGKPRMGNCRGNPPTAFVVPSPQGLTFNSVYPPVSTMTPTCRVYKPAIASRTLANTDPVSRA